MRVSATSMTLPAVYLPLQPMPTVLVALQLVIAQIALFAIVGAAGSPAFVHFGVGVVLAGVAVHVFFVDEGAGAGGEGAEELAEGGGGLVVRGAAENGLVVVGLAMAGVLANGLKA